MKKEISSFEDKIEHVRTWKEIGNRERVRRFLRESRNEDLECWLPN